MEISRDDRNNHYNSQDRAQKAKLEVLHSAGLVFVAEISTFFIFIGLAPHYYIDIPT